MRSFLCKNVLVPQIQKLLPHIYFTLLIRSFFQANHVVGSSLVNKIKRTFEQKYQIP